MMTNRLKSLTGAALLLLALVVPAAAQVKISELPDANTTHDAVIPIVQETETRKAPISANGLELAAAASYADMRSLLGAVNSVTIAAGTGLSTSGTCTITTSGTCTVGLADQVRQNQLLNCAGLAKALAGYQRTIETFCDGYKAIDGVNSGDSSNYMVDTSNGYVGPTMAAGSALTGGTAIGNMTNNGGLTALFDGNTSQTGAGSTAAKAPASPTNGAYGGKDFGSGNDKAVGSVTVYPATDEGYDGNDRTITLNLRGKATSPSDGADGTLLGTTGSFADTTSSKTITSTDQVTQYRYIWVQVVASATPNNIYLSEIQLFGPSTPNNATVVTTTQTADATVTGGRVLMEYDPIDSITLNTDLTAELTCDSGSHWTSGTLSSVGKGQGGRTVAETSDTTCGTSGTGFAARIETLNNKNVRVYKTAVTVR